ncbi:NAD(P)H-hydrate dehydratase [Parasphingorhabdus sp.]|uniref:NAD(P)H-hydrate dehydratase n=1 Tax=Parasphingorhabdus sp. TaxID=2709688 RepID=UPI003A90DE95
MTAAEMQLAEQALIAKGISVEQLMRQAGQGAAQMIWRVSADLPTLVLCGPGNNGGDGYVIAQWLREKGVDVRVAAPLEPKTPAAQQAKSRWAGDTISLADAVPAPQFVDCLFGTGLARAVGDDWFAHFSRLFDAAKRRVAIDLPSGIESDTGILLNRVKKFDITIGLGAYKPSHFLEPARSLMGDLVGIDIGVAAGSDLRILPEPRLSAPGSHDHKYSRGLVAVVAGAMPGAAQLTAMAAQKSGAGYVKIFGSAGLEAPHPSIVVETVDNIGALQQKLSDNRISAVVIGPGLGRDDHARELLTTALAVEVPLLLDADALVIAGTQFGDLLQNRNAETIATPHAGEFAGLVSGGLQNKLADSRNLANQSGCTILLKGSDSVIVRPDGQACISAQSCPWLSTAGTGDILAGVIASRLAIGASGYKAACEGQWLHSRAAQLAGPAFTPEILIDHIPAALQECL